MSGHTCPRVSCSLQTCPAAAEQQRGRGARRGPAGRPRPRGDRHRPRQRGCHRRHAAGPRRAARGRGERGAHAPHGQRTHRASGESKHAGESATNNIHCSSNTTKGTNIAPSGP